MLRKIITVFIIVSMITPLVILAMNYCGACCGAKAAPSNLESAAVPTKSDADGAATVTSETSETAEAPQTADKAAGPLTDEKK